jgi:hypothetical protein
MSALTSISEGHTFKPKGTVTKTSASFDSCLHHKAVIDAGHMKMCEWSGLVCLASHNCSTTARAIAGGGAQINWVSQ